MILSPADWLATWTPDMRGAKSPVRLMGVRGFYEGASGNRFAIYDDAIIVEIEGEVSVFRASVDPTWALVLHPINPGGAAQLQPGVWNFGHHLLHGKYPCLGQSEAVTINRLHPDGTVARVETGEYGICIHSGGEGMQTNRFSAGCQIIQNPNGYFGNPAWQHFIGPIFDAMTIHQLKAVPYLLVDPTGGKIA
jgi:hypothetical protein